VTEKPHLLVIPKEKAVFWMDARGHWCNRHGRIRHPKVIAHFNASIRRDADGYHLFQEREGLQEKVYFRYEETPLFVVNVVRGETVMLETNTRGRWPVDPKGLYMRGDALYMETGGEVLKFTEEALVRFSPWIEGEGDAVFLRLGEGRWRIPERE
jgi:hypothetical protein